MEKSQPGDHQPVEETADDADEQSDQHAEPDGNSGNRNHHGDRAGQGNDRSDREIDATGDNGEGYTDAHQRYCAGLQGETENASNREEVRRHYREKDKKQNHRSERE